MTTFLQFAVLGFGIAAVYSLLSQGLIVIYQGSGVLNFSQAGMAMLGAYAYWEARVVGGWSFWPAFLVTVGIIATLGVLVYLLIMRPLRHASAAARAIASLGILILIQGVVALKWSSVPRNTNPIFPFHVYNVSKVVVPGDRLYLLALAVGLTAMLWAAYRFSPVGLGIRASAENARSAATLGWSADALGVMTWALGSGLAAVAGVLISPITGINPEEMPYYVLPVLAAALVAGFTSFWGTLAASLVLGIVSSEFVQYVNVWGLDKTFPFLVIVILLLVRGQGLPVRGQVVERLAALGTGRIWWRWLIPITIGWSLLSLFVFSTAFTDAMTITYSWAIIMYSVVVLLGYCGQLSLAQFALAGIAALMSARLVSAGVPFELAFLLAVLGTLPVGLAFALPALRTRGINLAVVTLGLAMGVNAMILTNTRYVGANGTTEVGRTTFFGMRIDALEHSNRWSVFVLVFMVLCGLGVAGIRRGASGRKLIAVRTNERAAASLGISVMAVKMYAFGVGTVLAAIGGVLLAFRNTNIVYTDYDPLQSILAVGYTVIGGLGFVLGAPFGGQLPSGGFGGWILDQLFSNPNPSWLVVVGGITLIALVVLHPDGAISVQGHAIGSLRRRLLPGAPAAAEGSHAGEKLAPVVRESVAPATLRAEGITVRFGGVVAVSDVSVSVEPASIVGLIGPNGAGKTTFIDAVTGFVRPTAGTVTLNDERIERWPVYRRARQGISRSFQQLELFESATVRENLAVASDGTGIRSYFTDVVKPRRIELSSAALAAVEILELGAVLDLRVSELPYGRRRLVAIARAIATRPSVLMLDEPAAGLSAGETAELATIVRRLATDWGFGILVVEHDMSFVMSICDRIHVLDFGRQIASGSPSEVRADPAVIAAYLGEPESDEAEPTERVGAKA